MTHECAYADLIGLPSKWLRAEDGTEVCQWCHEDKYPKVTKPKARVTTNKKKEVA